MTKKRMRKRPAKTAIRRRAAAPTPAPAEKKDAAPRKVSITSAMLAWARQGAKPKLSREDAANLIFRLPEPPPGILPKGVKPQMAMDTDITTPNAWAAQSLYNVAFTQGYEFLGYPYLAQLAQVTEYRRIAEVIASEMTRKWIKIQSAADEAEKKKNAGRLRDGNAGKTEKIKELTAEFDRLKVKEIFQQCALTDGFFGRANLYIDTGATDDPNELKTPIGDGKNDITKAKIEKGSIQRLTVVEPLWTYPGIYNANNPLRPDFYNPSTWYSMGTQLHVSRFLPFTGRPVPDILKPVYMFGGLSLTQMAQPYVNNWLETRQSINDLIKAFSTMVLKTNMGATQEANDSDVFRRIDFFNLTRDNRGTMVIDEATEDFANVSAPLGTLDHLQAQALEHICSAVGIPLVKYTGISPSGLNASSEGEIRVFYDWVHAYQEVFFGPNLTKIFHFAQMNIWGAIDEDLSYVFEPLWSLDDLQLATLRKTEAETAGIYIDHSVISQEEDRRRLAGDADGPYNSLDVEAVPEPEGPEAGNIHERVDDDPDNDDAEGEVDKAA